MMKHFLLSLGLMAVTTVASLAQTLNVTTPASGDFLGQTNQLRFTMNNVNVQIRLFVRVRNAATNDLLITRQNDFNPNASGEIDGSVDLNFNRATPETVYNLEVQATGAGGININQTITNITIDVNAPKFREVSPANNTFVRSLVQIASQLEESFIDLWRVQVNGQDIPNNTGNGTNLLVTWDPSSIERDGTQSVNINVKDLAKNESNRGINVTLDRVAPTINIASPTSTPFRPGTTIPVSLTIIDQFQNSVFGTNVDVLVVSMGGTVLQRVSRISTRNNGNNLSWNGRIRNTTSLPRQFRLRVTASDRAGNVAAQQEITVNLR